MNHKTLQTDGGTIHYWIQRSAQLDAHCIVFTHGVAGDHTMFDKQVEHLAEDYTLITWDTPRHGQSRAYEIFSYGNNAEVLKAILDAESIDAVVLVGMSNGGYTSQEFGHRYPDRVKGFIALDTTPFGLKYYSKQDMRIFRWFVPMIRLFPARKIHDRMAKSCTHTDEAFNAMKTMQLQYNKADIIELAGHAYGCLMTENKDVDFPFPVWILLGEHDDALNVDKYSKMWAEETGYPLHIIPDAGHFSNGDNADAVNAHIRNFITRL